MIRLLSICLLATALAAGCGSEGKPAGGGAPGDEQAHQPVADGADKVVAEVNGTPILAIDLKAQLEARGDDKIEEALEELIQLELLAQEARRRGLGQDKEALHAKRQAMAFQMLESNFHEIYGPHSVPEHMVKKAYRKFRARYNHPELVKVTHVLAVADTKKRRQKATPAQRAAAKKMAQAMHAAVAGKEFSSDEFVAAAREAAARFPDVKFHSEALTTDLKGRNVIEFTTAAFKLKKEGGISPVVETIFGYHVIRLQERIPERRDPLAKVEQEVREGIKDLAKSAVFNEWIQALSKKYKIEVKMEVLTAALEAGSGAPASKAAGARAR